MQATCATRTPHVQKSAFNGVITALPTPGTTLGQGDHVYTVAGTNAYLLHGAIPSWRSFEEGMSDGQDVVQLETALSERATSSSLLTGISTGTPLSRSRSGRRP